MKHFFEGINNKAFDNRIRLGIMSMLMVNDWVDFVSFKEALDLSDGNLASHLSTLEKEQYIHFKKEFNGRKPQTSYAATQTGRDAFVEYLNALEKLIKNIQ